jgi:hypothetical protein
MGHHQNSNSDNHHSGGDMIAITSAYHCDGCCHTVCDDDSFVGDDHTTQRDACNPCDDGGADLLCGCFSGLVVYVLDCWSACVTNSGKVSKQDRSSLVGFVTAECVDVSHLGEKAVLDMIRWCETHLGAERSGCILTEAQEGHIDYFDGDWQHSLNYSRGGDLRSYFWFAKRSDRTQFLLTWM